MIDLGQVKPGSTIRIPFGSYAAATGASAATTNYAAADIQIYKDGSATQRASTAGFTATADFDTLTGINLVVITLSDNTTTGFFTAGSEYIVVVADVTIDAQTVRFPIARFTIDMPGSLLATSIATLASQTSFTLTAGSANDSTYVGCVAYVQAIASAIQCAVGYISAYTGATKTVTLAQDPAIYTMAAGDNIILFPPSNTQAIGANTTAGTNAKNNFTSTGYTNANNSIGAVSGAVGSVTGNVGGNVNGSVGSVAANGISAASLATDAGTELAAAVMASVIEGSYTLTQAARLMMAALGGKASGLGGTSPVYRDTGDSKNRISATTDADGNRSAITLDLS